MLLVGYVCSGALGMPLNREPLQKRGPRAWAAAREYVSPLVNRLHIHAVDDDTNVLYAKHVRAFLIDAKRQVHPWIRLNRVVRDIPSQYVLGGVDAPSTRRAPRHAAPRRARPPPS